MGKHTMIKISSGDRLISDGVKRVPYRPHQLGRIKTYQVIRIDLDGSTPWIETVDGRIWEYPLWK